MTTFIEFKKTNISFLERIKYYVLIFIGIISLISLISFIKSDKGENVTFIIIMSIIFALAISYKLYQQRHFLIFIKSDSKTIEVEYLNYSEREIIKSEINKIEIELKNTSSRSGFNCELIIRIENKKFTINNDFNWSFAEMEEIFQFIKFHKGENLTEKEKHTISRIENKLKQNPF